MTTTSSQPAGIFNRRRFLSTAPALLPAASLAGGAQETDSTPPMTCQAAGDDPLYWAAVELGTAIDLIASYQSSYDTLTPDAIPRKYFDEKFWDPACEAQDRAEERLLELMRERRIPAVVVRGRLYADWFHSVTNGLTHYPAGTTVVDVSSIVQMDVIGGAR